VSSLEQLTKKRTDIKKLVAECKDTKQRFMSGLEKIISKSKDLEEIKEDEKSKKEAELKEAV